MGSKTPMQVSNITTAITALRSGTAKIKSDICTKLKFNVSDFKNVSTLQMKQCSVISKEVLSTHLLDIIQLSDDVCGIKSSTASINQSVSDFANIVKSNHKELTDLVNDKLSTLNTDLKINQVNIELINKSIVNLNSRINNFKNEHSASVKTATHENVTKIIAPEQHIFAKQDNFLTVDESEKLSEFLSKIDYKFENGHDVKNFGNLYKYTGAADKSSDPIPNEIQSVIDKITELCSDRKVDINQCLINRYQNGDSILPNHSDDESDIDPESFIYTLSLGQERNLIFTDKFSGAEFTHSCKERELYMMTRSSQAYFSHRIDRDNSSSVRYSLTFRHVNPRFSHSTILIGDSNTKKLNFGEGKGSFGVSLPGKRLKASTVSDINPHDCAAYANVVFVVGTNNLRKEYISCKEDISNVFDCFAEKIALIRKIRKNIKIVIIPVPPTRLIDMNRRIMCYNTMLHQRLIISSTYFNIKLVPIYEFLDNQGLLRRDFLRDGDYLHFNDLGLSRLAFDIKNAIFNRAGHSYNKPANARTKNTPTAKRDESRPA